MAHRFAPLLVAATAFAQTPLPGFNSTAQFMTSSATCSYFSVSVAVAAWQANASAIIALSPLTGQASVFVTAEYDGTAGTLVSLQVGRWTFTRNPWRHVPPPPLQPGPDSSVCQWQAAYTGAATTVVIAPGSSPCYDTLPTSSSVSAPVTFTLCVTSGPHSYAAVEWIVGAPGAAQAQPWGGAPTIQLGPFDPALVLDLAPVVFLAPPATAAPGASAGAVSIGILSSHVRGPPDFTAATNSLLVVATPQLADADVAVFVSLDSSPPPVCDVGAGGSSEVICSGWTWAFSTAAGGGALLIDALDPCTLSSLATLNGPPPAINTTACDAGNFMAAGSVWVLVVPLFAGGFPPPGSQA